MKNEYSRCFFVVSFLWATVEAFVHLLCLHGVSWMSKQFFSVLHANSKRCIRFFLHFGVNSLSVKTGMAQYWICLYFVGGWRRFWSQYTNPTSTLTSYFVPSSNFALSSWSKIKRVKGQYCIRVTQRSHKLSFFLNMTHIYTYNTIYYKKWLIFFISCVFFPSIYSWSNNVCLWIIFSKENSPTSSKLWEKGPPKKSGILSDDSSWCSMVRW